MTIEHDHEYCINPDSPSGIAPGCPNFGEDLNALLPADKHHFDVSCDDRPDCVIPQHHAMEDMP
jgi:hypothetical protein